ncbi:hypothetical protein CKM354_000670400 [Cercospora kikuchii]|uniref:Uncharacterized protein n=1 Tax=Cercospora kikuchii TaxID=84275 RepID=A0A9P3CLB2_9PEZI|nr:uncharacterized protein CKM354_000670400 [Cercospora kikuchii]GIZ43477.1 hypothetical protein CKM354_000670400 [Cercospora kikuchii]
MSSIHQIAIIGLGHRGYKTHFLSLHGSDSANVVAVCESNRASLARFSAAHPDVPAYLTIEDMIASSRPDFAIIALPHDAHPRCVALLSKAAIPILKEKPAAKTLEETTKLLQLPIPIGIMCQRRFEPRYQTMQKFLPGLGRIVSFRAVLARNIPHLGSSWRSSGVGVTEDMGVHMIDILVQLFGAPDTLQASRIEAIREEQDYSGDDIADITFKWRNRRLVGNIHLSRVAGDEESIFVTGTNGTAVVNEKKITLFDNNGVQCQSTDDTSTKQSVIRDMVFGFGDYIKEHTSSYASSLESHRETVATMEAIQRAFESGNNEPVQPSPTSTIHCATQPQDMPSKIPTTPLAQIHINTHSQVPSNTSEEVSAVPPPSPAFFQDHPLSMFYQHIVSLASAAGDKEPSSLRNNNKSLVRHSRPHQHYSGKRRFSRIARRNSIQCVPRTGIAWA